MLQREPEREKDGSNTEQGWILLDREKGQQGAQFRRRRHQCQFHLPLNFSLPFFLASKSLLFRPIMLQFMSDLGPVIRFECVDLSISPPLWLDFVIPKTLSVRDQDCRGMFAANDIIVFEMRV